VATVQSNLTKAQLDALRGRLEAERARLTRVVRDTAELPTPPRDEPAELEESAQRAADADQELGVSERERALLAEIERALGKLDAGTYGIGETTGDPIPYERLAAVPWARDAADAE
jgi:RNA polymerase-binding transcription factor